jgi:hypothetical protein
MDPSFSFALWTVSSTFRTPFLLRKSSGSVTTPPGEGRGQASGATWAAKAPCHGRKHTEQNANGRRFLDICWFLSLAITKNSSALRFALIRAVQRVKVRSNKLAHGTTGWLSPGCRDLFSRLLAEVLLKVAVKLIELRYDKMTIQ